VSEEGVPEDLPDDVPEPNEVEDEADYDEGSGA
jgi:hypothetical protein